MKTTTIDEIFWIYSGTDLELNNLEQQTGNVRFVSRTRKNNGVSATVKKLNNIELLPANSITVALSSASVLFAFLQEVPYYTGYHIACLVPKIKMTKQEMLYYCTCITANRYKYNFGRQANKTIATLKVPKREEIPDWVNSTHIQDLTHLDEPLISQKPLEDMSYEIFDFDELFGFSEAIVHDELNRVNLVSALTKNNGVKGTVETNTYIDGNKITITSNGIYTGTAFYQENPFITQDSIAIKLLDRELNKYIAMYLIGLFNNEKFRFNYGRKSGKTKIEQLKFRLPVCAPNQPDWAYIENFIKSLPYSKNI